MQYRADRHDDWFRTAEAIEWLERGRAGVDRWDHRASGLADLLVELYTEAGRTEDVIALWQARFQSEGSVETYRVLREAIRAANPGRWPEQREQAWSLLRRRADVASLWSAGDVYVRVLLLEDEAAWEWACPVLTDIRDQGTWGLREDVQHHGERGEEAIEATAGVHA
ncbi:hypothetical protein ABT297_42840 [Dactylosporangium sp. NPDC000555]|uniref:hypothetical protein n=1 Tax=Dactylosporangium sp. NPDC000555 TaxID=3154260 RepID=UPI00332CEDB4